MRIYLTLDSSSPRATSTCRLGLLAAALIAAASACDPAPPTPTVTRPATPTVHRTETPPQPTVTVTALLPDTLYLTQTPEPLVPVGCVEAQVVEFVDGHTINVRIDGQEYAVRYIGIDAPETYHPEKGV